RSPAPTEVQLGPTVRETRQHIVRRHIAMVPDTVHVPPVRGTQGDDLAGPVPTVPRLLEILEDDATGAPLDDLPLVRLALEFGVPRRVVRTPSEREIERHAERRGDVVLRSPSRPLSVALHDLPLPMNFEDLDSAIRGED